MPEVSPQRFKRLVTAFLVDNAAAAAAIAVNALRHQEDLLGAVQAHVMADELQDFLLTALQQRFALTAGFVYLATGPAHAGLVKVGKTAKSPSQRLASLNSAAVLLPLGLEGFRAVHDRHWVEAETHRQLKRQHVAHVKEFFDERPAALLTLIDHVAQQDRENFSRFGVHL